MHHETLKIQPGDTWALLAPGTPKAQEIKETVLKKQQWSENIRIPNYQGADHWQTIKISAVLDEQGQIINYLAFIIDITQNMQDKQHALEQHRKLQHLFKVVEAGKQEWEHSLDCINNAVILTDHNGIIKRVNSAITQLLNINIADILGQDWRSLLPDELKNQIDLPVDGEYYDQIRDKWLRYKTFPFNSESLSTQVSQVITLHDITESQRITNELASAYEHQKATQSQLVHQEKMASIGQLAAGVAHEINNPTGFITSNLVSLGKYTTKLNEHIAFLEQSLQQIGNTELLTSMQQHRQKLKLSFIQEDIKDLIEESLEGAERIKIIVNNLKSFSRVDDTGFFTSNLHECLDAALNIGWNEIKYKATVTKDFQPIPDVYCSAQQLNQVFLNLLVNAAQALQEQGEINIQTITQEPWVIIKISDNGSGIAPEHLSRIFEPFFTTKDVGKGTGLGLSICYDIIQQHHGEIDVESTLGQGTTFIIKLPIAASPGDEENA